WSEMDAIGGALKSERSEISVFETGEDLAHGAAEECVRLALGAVAARDTFSIALAGGSTPKRLYALLASGHPGSYRHRFPWEKTDFFWGDERHVPPDHADSNYRMASDAMLAKVPLAPSRVHRIQGELPDAALAAENYEQVLLQQFHLSQGNW